MLPCVHACMHVHACTGADVLSCSLDDSLAHSTCQVVPTLEARADVFRYSWYSVYEDGNLPGNHLNENIYRSYPGQMCQNVHYLGAGKWPNGPTTFAQCAALAGAAGQCSTPLAVAYENAGDQNCYCATDACSALQSAWNGITQSVPIASASVGQLTALGQAYNQHAFVAADPPPPSPPPSPPMPPPLPPATPPTRTIASTCSEPPMAGWDCVCCLERDCPYAGGPVSSLLCATRRCCQPVGAITEQCCD